jgi:hypothetical protein
MPYVKKIKQQDKVEAKCGYFLYENGVSRWGINLYRNGKVGVEITKEQHRLSQDEKVKLYVEPAKKEVSS